jgi:predicted outer membrane repeat protein
VTVAAGVTATISGVTMTGGFAQLGAGVQNEGHLTLKDADVVENNGLGVGAGGTIYNGTTGVLTLIHARVADNMVVDGVGGGIFNRGSAFVRSSVVSENGAEFVGAGIYNDLDASMTIVDTIVSNNFSGMVAGGIENRGTLSIRRSSVTRNTAQTFGGGILNNGLLDATGSTVDGNSASWGGGIYSDGNATLRGAIVTANTAQVEGGGIFNAGELQLLATDVFANDPDDCLGC